MNYYVYILANATNTAIYVGVTKDLVRRMYEHKHKLDPGSFLPNMISTNWYITNTPTMCALQSSVKSR